MDFSRPSTQRRRSERVAESLPIVVRGIDLLGQPFEERTATLAFNLHGCRYASKHHLPKNTWVTLELARGAQLHNVRARVAWIQRPHSVREFFQIAVELETPANIWAFEPAPGGWTARPRAAETISGVDSDFSSGAPVSTETNSAKAIALREEPVTNMSDSMSTANNSAVEHTAAVESPLARASFSEMSSEIEQRAKQAVDDAASQAEERIRRAAEEIAAEQSSRLSDARCRIEESFGQARRLMEDVEKRTSELRSENQAAAEASSRVAQARLELEAVEVARAAHPGMERPKEESPIFEAASAGWRERLASETSVAQAQWNELLQSSLDSGVQRLVERLSERSQEIVRTTESRFSERFNELRQPLVQLSTEARETLAEVKSSLDQELTRAKASLAEIEHSASRMNEFSAQLEAATQDSLSDLRRRLEGILETQTEEMSRRAESVANATTRKVAPALESFGQKVVDQTVADVEAKVALHLDRVPELLSELSAREIQMEEALRLHRERLRQVSENSQRDLSSRVVTAVSQVRDDFENARKEAIARWNEELDASGIRASHAAAESIERSSQWFQQETQARLQALVEQSLTGAGAALDEKLIESKQKLVDGLADETAPHVAQMREKLDSFSGELAGRARTQIEQAAEATAAAFGQVLRGISDQEAEHFSVASQNVVRDKNAELEASAVRFLGRFEADAEVSLTRFRQQIASEVEANVAAGRSALAGELSAVLGGYRAEHDVRQKEWLEGLDRISDEAAGRYRERLDTASDSWMVCSVRRLNEHGQNVIESLMRSADQALRESCARFFDGIAETLRNRAGSNGAAIHVPGVSAGEAMEIPPEHNDSTVDQPRA